MTLRTGKGGQYRCYTCSIKARQGETGCKGRSIPMDKLDDLVAGHIEDRLLFLFDYLVDAKQYERVRDRQPERLRGLEIDHDVELGRQQHRQIGRLDAFQDLSSIVSGLAIGGDRAGAIADQTTGSCEFIHRIERRNFMARRQCQQ